MKQKFTRKIAAIITIFSLLLSLVNPLIVFAEEPTTTPTDTPSPTLEINPTPTTQPTLTIEPSTTITPTLTPSVTPSTEPTSPTENTLSTNNETLSSTPTASPIQEPEQEVKDQSAKLLPDTWVKNEDGSYTTNTPVTLNTDYKSPFDSKLRITFTKLPQNPGTITVKEIKLSKEEQEALGSFSDIAYEITSTMENGTFEYTLTLPTPKTENVEVKLSEDGKNFATVAGVTVQKDTLTITNLTHFTIFVVAGTVSNNVATPFDETNSNVLINEFVVNPLSGNEWVEFFNRTDDEINLTDWQICEVTSGGSENCYTLSFTKLLPNGFAVHELTNKLNNPTSNGSGDRITLRNSNGVTIDQVTYQKNNSQIVNAQGLGQNTIRDDESIGRSEDGGNIWQIFSETTKGYNNSGDLVFITVGQNFPYGGIQNALNDITEGGTVYVTEGEYTETVYIKKSVTLIGADRDNTTIFDYDCSEDPTISLDADNVTVKNLTINNDGCEGSVVWIGDGKTGVIIQNNRLRDGYYGVELRNGSSQIQILDNVISDNEGNGIYSGGEGALSGITISDNSIENNQDTGVYLGQLIGTITISGNTISNNSYFGVYLGTIADAAVTIGGVENDANTITNNGYQGLSILSVDANSTVTIRNNTIQGNNTSGNGNTGGISIDSIGQSPDTVTIQDNDISNNAGIGIYIYDTIDSTLTITGNTINNNTAQGIYLAQTSGSEVTIGESNAIKDNSDAGIYLDSSVTGVEITGNTIQNNGTESMTTGIVVNNAKGNQAHKNIISNNGSLGVSNEDEDNVFDATRNFWGGASGPFHETANPNGFGNNGVSDNVDFRPFYIDENRSTLNEGTIIIVKDSGQNDAQDFTFTRSFGTNFSLDDDADNTLSNTAIFSSLEVGPYTVTENEVNGWSTTNIVCGDPDSGSLTNTATRIATIDVDAGETITCAFTNTKLSTISGKKFNDLDADGTDDHGTDPGLGGWTIFLDTNNNGATDNGELTTTTDSSGAYSFTNLAAGTYNVREILQTNWQQTTATPSAITASAGSNHTNINFGNVRFQELQQAKFVATSGNSNSTSSVLVLNTSTINVSANGGTHTVFLPANTTITRSDGGAIDVSRLAAQTVTGSLSGIGSGVVVDGALQWGIPDLGLEFSQPITLSIYVGTALNGQTLNVHRSTSQTGGWNQDGIRSVIDNPNSPATCTVVLGICTFYATKASYYATTHTTTTSTTSTTTSSASGGGGSGDGKSDGLGCGSHDCSGGSAVPEAQVLGALTQLAAAAGFTPEVPGEKTAAEEKQDEKEELKEAKGAKEEKGTLGEFTKEPKSTSSNNNILFVAAVIVLLLAGAFIFLSRRKVS